MPARAFDHSATGWMTPATDREFEFTQADFERIRQLIRAHAGIALAPAKQDMVYSRLARRLRALGLARFDDYLRRLDCGDKQEWETFINSLTTNLTAFFREAHHFDMFARQARDSRQRPFRVWCAAASTGEEPYSLAISACEAFDSLTPPVQIVASDIDTNVLAAASRGLYAHERIERLAAERVRRYFAIDNATGPGNVRIRPELQRLVSFSRINLLDSTWSIPGPLDAIFCRNVMIYFDKPTQYEILKKFKPLLRDDGLLYAGHSESFLHAADLFRPLGRTVYERSDRLAVATRAG
jgi:chemotaxis protein methyltransferase CheR